MGMFDSIRKLLNIGARKKTYTGSDGHSYVGSSSYGSTMAFYKGQSYDNTYPSVNRIVSRFMKIRPYAINANGKPVEDVRLINKLYHPNLQMSSVDFREALAVMSLVHRKVYLLAWREDGGKLYEGGPITPDNIAGFTFLEGVSEITTNGETTYHVGSKRYTENDVIVLYSGLDPYDLSRGYSPSIAASKWASLDDYIAAYQAGFFENGAVPSGEFVITASNATEFNNIVDEIQKKHRGSGRNNNVIYTHRPISPATGQPVSAQIEWIPFAQTNKEMALDQVFKQTNDKVDSMFGVPASIRGVNDNNTYASVRVDQQIFVEEVIDTFALRIWTRFTHEMNRLTGGLGYAITYDLVIPNVADEDKVDAERKKVELDLIKQAVEMGYSLDSIVDAFELSNGYKVLKMSNEPAVIENDKPDVDNGNEVDDSPDATTLEQNKTMKHGNTVSGGHCCSETKSKDVSVDNEVVDNIAGVVREQMKAQIDDAIDETKTKEVGDVEEEELKETVEKLLAIIMAYMLVRGKVSYEDGITLLKQHGQPITGATEYAVSEITQSAYQAYLYNVCNSYAQDTAIAIRKVLAESAANEWDHNTLADKLRGIMNTDEWRVQRLARTEEHRVWSQSSVDSMTQLMNETGNKIYKVWMTNTDACEYCQSMEGKRELVSSSFLPYGGTVEGVDGGVFQNNFVDVDSANLHPNCSCYVTYEVEDK